jgi:hypothetical protein
MSLVSQFDALDQGWSEARFVLTVADDADCARAASLLAPAHPLRRGKTIRIHCSRSAGVGPDAVRRLLARVDRAGITGTLELAGADAPAPVEARAHTSLAQAWDDEVALLPPDWSDVYAELALASSDLVEPVALLMSPANPSRAGRRAALRFRVARRFGYGISPTMTRRVLERLDEAAITGELQILRVLSDTHNVATQGPVWRVGGRAV